MTADIELLPLPEADDSVENRAQWPIVIDSDVWLQKSVQDYARACVAHSTAAKDAEIAQLEKANEQLHAHGERMHAEIETLRAERDRAVEAGEIMARHLDTLEPRAERLAEALRMVEAWIIDYVPDDVGGRKAELREVQTALRNHD